MTQSAMNIALRMVDACVARNWRGLIQELERAVPNAELLELIPTIHLADGSRQVSFSRTGGIIVQQQGQRNRPGTIDDLAEVIQQIQENIRDK